MDKRNEIHRLIVASLKNDISEEERDRLQAWLQTKESHRILFHELVDAEKRKNDIREFASFHTTGKWKELEHKIESSSLKKRRLLMVRTIAAAVIITVMVAVNLIYRQQTPQETMPRTEIAQIVPGSPHAILISENGQKMVLGEEISDSRQIIFGTDTLKIIQGKSLNYEQTRMAAHAEWHTLQIPRGGEFRLTLEDGTEVWLNSESELKYPAHFTGHERRVILSGEAYFEVAPDSRIPFIVMTSKMVTKVLGTSFNVSAYPDENKTHTTLIGGSVEITDKEKNETIGLQPGEQALLQDGKLSVRTVDTKLYSLWRNDRFTFSSEYLEEVTRKLSRWYNVEFLFTRPPDKQKQFSGSLPKYSDISQVLGIIEMTTNIKFEIKNNTIIIR